MADDVTSSAITHGLALVAGGGTSGVVMRLLFGGFLRRLDDIDSTLKQLIEKGDQRHEKVIERLAQVEGKADAAHRRLDEMNSRRGRSR